MNFASRELSEKLVAAGCVSASLFVWSIYHGPVCKSDATFSRLDNPRDIPAFLPTDFTGANKQAEENAKRVWGEGKALFGPTGELVAMWEAKPEDLIASRRERFEFFRHGMIDAHLKDCKDEWDYLEKTSCLK